MDRDADESPRTVDVLKYPRGDDTYRLIEAGKGEQVVEAHEHERQKQTLLRRVVTVLAVVGALGIGVLIDNPLVGGLGAVIFLGAFWYGNRNREAFVPTVVERNMYPRNAADRYDIDEGATGQD